MTEQLPEYIGDATMTEDGTIILNLRAEGDGIVGHGQFTYTPDQPEYKDVLDHIGGIKPGERKPVRPWD